MRTKSRWSLLIIAGFLGAAGFRYFPQESQDIEIQLTMDKKTYTVGEDIPLSIQITNRSSRNLSIDFAVHLSQLHFLVKENDEGDFHIYSYGYTTAKLDEEHSRLLGDGTSEKILKPRESIKIMLSVIGGRPFRGLFPYDTPRKGEYKIILVFSQSKETALEYIAQKHSLKKKCNGESIWVSPSVRNEKNPVYESNEISFKIEGRAGEQLQSFISGPTLVDGRGYEASIWKEGDKTSLFYQRRYDDRSDGLVGAKEWFDDYIPYTLISPMEGKCRYLNAVEICRQTKIVDSLNSPPHCPEPCWIIWQDGDKVKCALVRTSVEGQIAIGKMESAITAMLRSDFTIALLARESVVGEKENYACYIVSHGGGNIFQPIRNPLQSQRISVTPSRSKTDKPGLTEEDGQTYFTYEESGTVRRIPIGEKIPPHHSESQEE